MYRAASMRAAAALCFCIVFSGAVAEVPSPPPASPAAELGFEIQEGLNINWFERDGKVAAHLVLRSGEDPRILIAFPAGNSGIGLWFSHRARKAAWTLLGKPHAVEWSDPRGHSLYGISAEAQIDAAELSIAQTVLSNVRVLRHYQEYGTVPGPVMTEPVTEGNTMIWSRDRLDGAPGYRLSLEVTDGKLQDGHISAGRAGKIRLRFSGLTGETPLTPFANADLLNKSAALDMNARNVLAFLSYQEKFLAGSWRFDTYFGRDTLMFVRLMMPVLNPAAINAGLNSVLARLSDHGEVAHEEDIGELAVLNHLTIDGSHSDAPLYNYFMIDGNYLLAPVARAWLLEDKRARPLATAFLADDDDQRAGRPHRTRGADLVANLRFVLAGASAFAEDPQKENLISLKPGRMSGEWRDSDEGIGRGRFPYDVNAILVPAALEAAGRFYASGLLDAYLSESDRTIFARAEAMAAVWRTRAPALFEVDIPRATAIKSLNAYARSLGLRAPISLKTGDVQFHAIALDKVGNPIPIMNSDEGFELLFGAPGAEALDRAVTVLMQPFPGGLMTGAGMLVANPAYSSPELQALFSRNAYHGTVVWSWQQALFAAGLERQLSRTELPSDVRSHLIEAQKALWAVIDTTRKMKNSELWSWTIAHGHINVAPFGAAAADADESNAAQLWSTVFLSVRAPTGR